MNGPVRFDRPLATAPACPQQQTGIVLTVRSDDTTSRVSRWPVTPATRPDLALTPGHVDIWFLFEHEAGNESALTAAYRALLTGPERQREASFHFARDRRRYLLTRALVRAVLSRYAPVAASDWRFAPDRYGRPMVVNDPALARAISFNISHSDGVIILATTCLEAIGVDVETVGRQACDAVARRHFSASEFAALKMLPECLQRQRFFELWTLKESYVKARGMGLSIPLNKFSFDLDSCPRVARCDDDFDDVAARWHFYRLMFSHRHIAALCLQRGAKTPTLKYRQVVPLVSERMFNSGIEN
jgi:4'-phosphopantetheinyl transferase